MALMAIDLYRTKRELGKARATNLRVAACIRQMSSKDALVRCVIQDILDGK